MNPRPRAVRSIDEDRRLRDVQERLDAQTPAATRCPTHQQRNPCTACAGDHRAGEHQHATFTNCPRCTPSEPRHTTFADRSSES